MRRISPHIVLTFLIFVVLSSDEALAGSVTVESKSDLFIVEAREASVDEVLERIGEVQGFRVDRIGQSSNDGRLTMRLEGPFDVVLERVLQNESHMIIYSQDTKTGINRLVLIGTASSPESWPAQTVTTLAVARPDGNVAASSVRPRPLPREIVPPPGPQRLPPVTRSGR